MQAEGVGGGGVEGKEEGLLCRKRNGSIRFTASLGGLEGCRKKECPLSQKVERKTRANRKKTTPNYHYLALCTQESRW